MVFYSRKKWQKRAKKMILANQHQYCTSRARYWYHTVQYKYCTRLHVDPGGFGPVGRNQNCLWYKIYIPTKKPLHLVLNFFSIVIHRTDIELQVFYFEPKERSAPSSLSIRRSSFLVFSLFPGPPRHHPITVGRVKKSTRTPRPATVRSSPPIYPKSPGRRRPVVTTHHA